MTGYGKSSVQKDDLTVEVEVKSLNSRFLDIFLKLPKTLNDREFEVRNLVKNKVSRGKISIGVYTGLLFGIRTYKQETKTDHVLYLPFMVDICLTIFNKMK